MNSIESKGFRVALGDMGSGYSSLNTIHILRPYKAVVASKLLEMAQELA